MEMTDYKWINGKYQPTRKKLQADLEECQRQREALAEVVRHMILSADASWEENNLGHDWAEACQEAREVLAMRKKE